MPGKVGNSLFGKMYSLIDIVVVDLKHVKTVKCD